MELVLENSVLTVGASIGFSTPKRLTDESVKNGKGDLKELQPTLMVGVPGKQPLDCAHDKSNLGQNCQSNKHQTQVQDQVGTASILGGLSDQET